MLSITFRYEEFIGFSASKDNDATQILYIFIMISRVSSNVQEGDNYVVTSHTSFHLELIKIQNKLNIMLWATESLI